MRALIMGPLDNILMQGFFIAVSSLSYVSCKCFKKNDYRFSHKHCGLSEVPNNIPATIKEVQLDKNHISDIRDRVFSRLSQCKELSLAQNNLISIWNGMFKGLNYLDNLDLKRNIISSIDPGSFASLSHLTHVNLKDNQLTTFNNPFSKPSSGSISLYLSGNPLHCDSSLCWLKNAESDGWIILKDPKPTCENHSYAFWDDVNLDCSLDDVYEVTNETRRQTENDNTDDDIVTEMSGPQDKRDKFLLYIVSGTVGSAFILVCTGFTVHKCMGSLRKSSKRESLPNKPAEVNIDHHSRQNAPLPDIPSPTHPRHYITPVNDGYEVPVNESYRYETIVGEEEEEIYAEVVDTEV